MSPTLLTTLMQLATDREPPGPGGTSDVRKNKITIHHSYNNRWYKGIEEHFGQMDTIK